VPRNREAARIAIWRAKINSTLDERDRDRLIDGSAIENARIRISVCVRGSADNYGIILRLRVTRSAHARVGVGWLVRE